MQNAEIDKAIPWNPRHGCKKVSPGCKNCFVYKMDRRYGRDTGLIKCVNVGGEMSPKNEIRPILYEWVRDLFLEAKERGIEFYFHQCGSTFIKDGVNIGKWNLNDQIKRAEEIQHELEELYGEAPKKDDKFQW